ncbi:MAG: amidohydrolase family protein [Planctomycetota bacterium]|nr:amidohydrolase family protein [Planctomycetota bacterium]
MRRVAFLIVWLSLGFTSPEQLQARKSDGYLITGATILDPVESRLIEGRQLILRDGRIESIAPDASRESDANLIHVDATGLIIMPGLIDLHSHLLLHPYDEAAWNDQVLKESLALRTIRGVTAAKRTLEAGFTTLRDLGTEGAGYADVGLRDAINQGIIPGPRIFAATRAIVATGSYGPAGFDPRWRMPKGAQVADGPVEVRKVVREQIANGADWIKVYADYRRRPGDPSTPTFSLEELKAIVDEATSAGIPVASHAATDEAIRRSVLAGVKTIEHGYQASREVLDLMRERGVVLCPTLMASKSMAIYSGWDESQDDHARIVTARSLMQRTLASRVIIACGSDVGVFDHGDNAQELELMADYGMSNADAIRAATTIAAKVLGMEKKLGRVVEGYLADLILVEGNPLEDLRVLRSPALVFKDGHLVIDRR